MAAKNSGVTMSVANAANRLIEPSIRRKPSMMAMAASANVRNRSSARLESVATLMVAMDVSRALSLTAYTSRAYCLLFPKSFSVESPRSVSMKWFAMRV